MLCQFEQKNIELNITEIILNKNFTLTYTQWHIGKFEKTATIIFLHCQKYSVTFKYVSMKILNFYFAFILCVSSAQWAVAQPNAQEKTAIETAFGQLNEAFIGKVNGKVASDDLIKKAQTEAYNTINRSAPKFRKSYPVFFELCSGINSCMKNGIGSRDSACEKLNRAYQQYLDIDKLPEISANAKKVGYNDYFGIPDIKFIEAYFTSTYAKNLNIKKGVACIEAIDKPNDVIEKTPVKIEDVKRTSQPSVVYEGEEDPIETLRKLINRVNITDFLEIEELVPGDGRIVPGVNGVPYEVRLKNAKTKDIIYFKEMEYIIPDSSATKSDHRWENYQRAMRDFYKLVTYILDENGNSSYTIFLQGSADKPTFKPRPLVFGYNTEAFQVIDLLTVDVKAKQVKEAQVKTGNIYDNDTLPDLRAAFIKHILSAFTHLRDQTGKINIVKGTVKVDKNPEKRNCSIVIFIDWDAAKKKSISNLIRR